MVPLVTLPWSIKKGPDNSIDCSVRASRARSASPKNNQSSLSIALLMEQGASHQWTAEWSDIWFLLPYWDQWLHPTQPNSPPRWFSRGGGLAILHRKMCKVSSVTVPVQISIHCPSNQWPSSHNAGQHLPFLKLKVLFTVVFHKAQAQDSTPSPVTANKKSEHGFLTTYSN